MVECSFKAKESKQRDPSTLLSPLVFMLSWGDCPLITYIRLFRNSTDSCVWQTSYAVRAKTISKRYVDAWHGHLLTEDDPLGFSTPGIEAVVPRGGTQRPHTLLDPARVVQLICSSSMAHLVWIQSRYQHICIPRLCRPSFGHQVTAEHESSKRVTLVPEHCFVLTRNEC